MWRFTVRTTDVNTPSSKTLYDILERSVGGCIQAVSIWEASSRELLGEGPYPGSSVGRPLDGLSPLPAVSPVI
jgi:hypothetical protein